MMSGDLARGQRLAADLHDVQVVASAQPDAILPLDHRDRVARCNPCFVQRRETPLESAYWARPHTDVSYGVICASVDWTACLGWLSQS